MQFLGIDLAWRPDNPSGVALLTGARLPLRLREVDTRLDHGAVLSWIAGLARRDASTIAIDAPLLGTGRRGRRECDNAVSRAFGAWHASTHTPPQEPYLREFTRGLAAAYGARSFDPRRAAERGRPAIREVYPNALQVLLFDLPRGARIVKYKRRHFGSNARWVEGGLRPFVSRCAQALGDRYVSTASDAWTALVARRPAAGMRTAELKAVEDCWDALLCAVAAALDHLCPGTLCAYGDRDWREGYILAPAGRGGPGST